MGNLVKETPYSEVTATLEVLDRLGMRREHFGRLRAEPDYAKRLVEFALRGGIEGSAYQKLARALMGNSFLGAEEWATLYGVTFTKKQLRQVTKFPWSEDVLNTACPFVKGKSVRETHFAFLGLAKLNGTQLTIMKWHELHPASGQPRFYFEPDQWYREEVFAKDATLEFRWHLLLTEIVPGSTNKRPYEQALPPEYELPTALAEVTKDLFVYRKLGAYPNREHWAHTKEQTSHGGFSLVGNCDPRGVNVDLWLGSPLSDVGVGAARKLPA